MDMDIRVDEVQRRLQSMVELRKGWAEPHQLSRELQRLFKIHDSDATGTISPAEFSTLLDKYPIGASREEASALFDRYDTNDNGLLTFAEFADGLFGLRPCPAATPSSRNIVRDVRRVLLKRTGNNIESLARCFRVIDKNRSGTLSKVELQTGLHRCGCEVSDGDMDTLLDLFDTNQDGAVQCSEFLRAVRGPLPERRKGLILAAFLTLDRNKDGTITLEELSRAYDTSQHPGVLAGSKTAEDVLQHLTEHWDGNGDAVVTLPEFLEYQRSVSASIDNDDHYELMMRNAWRLPGGESVCENTANLRVLVTHANGSRKLYAIDQSLGVKPTDSSAIKRCLTRQGVDDIRRVEVA